MSSPYFYYYSSNWPKGTSCPGCTVPLILRGSDWKSTYTTALFAIDLICVLAFVALAVLACLPRAKTGRLLYLGSVVSSIIYVALTVLGVGLAESHRVITYSFYIVPVFQLFFALLASTLTLLTLFTLAGVGRIAILAMGGLLLAFTVAMTGLQIREAVYEVNLFYLSYNYTLALYMFYLSYIQTILKLVFNILLLLGTIYSVIMLVKRQVVVILGSLAAFFFVVHSIFNIASNAIYLSTVYKTYYNTENIHEYWFTNVVSILNNVLQVITLVLLLLACGRAAGLTDRYAVRPAKYQQNQALVY